MLKWKEYNINVLLYFISPRPDFQTRVRHCERRLSWHISWDSTGRNNKTTEYSNTISGNLAEIRTGYLQNTSREPYSHTNVLGLPNRKLSMANLRKCASYDNGHLTLRITVRNDVCALVYPSQGKLFKITGKDADSLRLQNAINYLMIHAHGEIYKARRKVMEK